METLGIVVIGRNEGERLRQCLLSAIGKGRRVVYVDSDSTDGSVELARSLGVDTIRLDSSVPLTAARARNTGFSYLMKVQPDVEFVQFVDGDCILVAGWLEIAYQTLCQRPEVVVVCGRRREEFPRRSIYNRLCNIEWNTPVGEAKACGGDAMMRAKAFQYVRGFNPALIAGEEPELCLRFRQVGGKILRLDADMTLHDARMTRFRQWWLRSQRAGHAYAEGAWLHSRGAERHWVKESYSIWFWGLLLPGLALSTAWLTHGISLGLLLGAYGFLIYRVEQTMHRQGLSLREALLYASFCVLGKFPQVQGQIQFHLGRLLGTRRRLIEYKS